MYIKKEKKYRNRVGVNLSTVVGPPAVYTCKTRKTYVWMLGGNWPGEVVWPSEKGAEGVEKEGTFSVSRQSSVTLALSPLVFFSKTQGKGPRRHEREEEWSCSLS